MHGGCGGHAEAFVDVGRHRHGHHRPGPHDDERWAGGGDDDFGGGGFGVRRPLRFLAWKLELEQEQVAKLATVLDELKIERAQAVVDLRRTTSALADAVEAEAFDEAKAAAAGEERVKSAERTRQAVQRALGKIHGILDAEQRQRFAYLIRTGALTI